MVWIDYAIIGIVGFSALISLVRGFLKEAMSLVTWFVAFFIASHFYPDLAVYFTPHGRTTPAKLSPHANGWTDARHPLTADERRAVVDGFFESASQPSMMAFVSPTKDS